MSEDRTQPPSNRRRQLAREEGQAAHSPELTAAAGWLAAVVAIWVCGGRLAGELVGLTRGVLAQGDPGSLASDPSAVASLLRGVALALLWPLGAIIASFVMAATLAHQLQVRGLCSARLLAPDPGRLWTPGRGPGLASRARKSGWAALKATIVVAMICWVIHARWWEVARLGSLGASAIAGIAGQAVLGLGAVIAAVLVIVGLADYVLCWSRFETMLRTTPEEQREDRKVQEGDVTGRAQRRRIARAWRGDAPELLKGASLLIRGASGLTVVLEGGPPPRRVGVRAVARTSAGMGLRRSADAAGIPQVEDAALALRLAAPSQGGRHIPADSTLRLAAVWPTASMGQSMHERARSTVGDA